VRRGHRRGQAAARDFPRTEVRALRRRPSVHPISVVEGYFVRSAGFYVRVGVLGAVTLMAFAILALRLWSLQVIQGARFAQDARAQSFRTVHFPLPRGAIFDRTGRLLVGTNGRLTVTADAATLGTTGAKGRWRPTSAGRAELRRLAHLAHVPLWKLLTRIRRSLVRSPFAPAIVLPSVPRNFAFFLEERAPSFRGIRVTALPQRWYPQASFGSEFLGLLGEVNANQLRKPLYRRAKPGQYVGQSGVEATYDRVLDAGLGTGRVRVDARGAVVGRLEAVPRPQTLRSLRLSVDIRLQRAAEQAIRDGIAFAHRAGHQDANAGAAVVLNPWNGAIYALASYPTFNQAAAAHDPRYLQRLLRLQSGSTLLLNRATQGLYPVGSTFKPIVAEAALASGMITPSSIIPCTGSLTVGNVVFHNVEAGINANLNLDQALAMSCDTWFYRLGTAFYARQASTGALDMQRWAMRLGLGQRAGIDVPGEYGGVVPTPAWLRRTFRQPAQRIWYEGYSVNLSIGQGYLAVTPLQLAVAYSALANGGKVVRPHVAQAVVSASGGTLRRLRFPPRRRLHLVDAWAIRQGLYDAAHAGNGTSAAIFGSFPVPVAGKTGTAQTPTGSDHSWYASWAPAFHPRVVVVVLIEHGGFGVEAAAPAAREIYSAFFHVH
jgi:penicillin-binding protein 2